ncbi:MULTISPECIES: RNA polymerase sigma factor [unclassified Nesterenkonia]|uniref:RNA polymerase sigma factor n=1 Tax=unclassified Nesterenkonia TaxID=2629769 RepID=UPI001F4CAB33|nr:sigma-70 family RNA polymerase sigma factor [Nesterenkonia sp. DZ6]MCH8561792.1 sigma-70 family RNA polymerase sigma factor [Nesterenkonia sp. YGD6]MCH8570299.1 sigma-70 family RNA polymerase sigma factor [Nesterenkonia sp. AY15]
MPPDRGVALDHQHLAMRFAAGEPAAMHDLYRQHGSFVFSLCMAALRHRQDAEDATQQVFTRAWRSRDTYDITHPTGAWLTGITRRVIADVFARREKDLQAAEAGADAAARDGAPQPTDAVVDRVVVQQSLNQLGPPQNEIIRLAYTEDLPLKIIAERLEMPLGTVKSHVHRGLARMRQSLEVHSD